MSTKGLSFFLGANTPKGFVSKFGEIFDHAGGYRTYIIKGGPGTGKSTLMRKFAALLEKNGYNPEKIFCASDPASFDAVIAHELKTSLVDGTAPHILEPKYPGASENILNLGEFWEEAKLASATEKIAHLIEENSRRHENCCRFLGAAASMQSDTYQLALDYTDVPKIAQAVRRLAKKELKPLEDKTGRETKRFLSAVTWSGVHSFCEENCKQFERIYVIEDRYGVVSRLYLSAMRSLALENGYDIISCNCPVSACESLEHIFIPEAGVAFVTSNNFHPVEFEAYRRIHAARFTDIDGIKAHKKRIGYNKKTAGQLIEEASNLLKEAKTIHDELEELYKGAVDFAQTNAMSEKLLEKLVN